MNTPAGNSFLLRLKISPSSRAWHAPPHPLACNPIFSEAHSSQVGGRLLNAGPTGVHTPACPTQLVGNSLFLSVPGVSFQFPSFPTHGGLATAVPTSGSDRRGFSPFSLRKLNERLRPPLRRQETVQSWKTPPIPFTTTDFRPYFLFSTRTECLGGSIPLLDLRDHHSDARRRGLAPAPHCTTNFPLPLPRSYPGRRIAQLTYKPVRTNGQAAINLRLLRFTFQVKDDGRKRRALTGPPVAETPFHGQRKRPSNRRADGPNDNR